MLNNIYFFNNQWPKRIYWTCIQTLYLYKQSEIKSAVNSSWQKKLQIEMTNSWCFETVRQILDVICKQRVWVFHQGIQTRENGMKHEREARVFYCFRVFGPLMKHEKRVVYITSQTKTFHWLFNLLSVITRWGTCAPGEYRFRHAFVTDPGSSIATK
jgi:hypothetical protein